MKINVILASLAILGGLSAAFTNHSKKNNLYPTWKFDNEKSEGDRIRYISASHLADLLYQKEQGVIVVDSRGDEAYTEYHIPSAILPDNEQKLSGLEQDRLLILYGSGGDPGDIKMAKEFKGKIYLLKGGIEEWYRMVLFPDFNELQIRNRQKLEEILNRSLYFGGTPLNSQLLNITQRADRYREGC